MLDLSNTPVSEIIATTCNVLQKGGLVIFPTETTYGAGVDATNPAAVEKLLAYKSRREGKPLSIAVTNKTMASEYVFLNQQADALIDQFLPGPVTIVCKDKGVVSPGVASEFGTLGLRIPDYQLILDILETYQKPITATSANGSGQRRPYSVKDLLDNLSGVQKEKIDLILDAGELPHNQPSTIIDTTLETPITLREGSTALAPNTASQTLITTTEEETKSIAGKLLLKHWTTIRDSGLIIALDGPLGVGKTVFTKGVAQFLGISETITSPTYSYIEEYDFTRHQTKGRLYHADLWKVESPEETQRLGFEDLLKPKTVTVIEWFSITAEHIQKLAQKRTIPIMHITLSEDGTKRILQITDTKHS